MVLSLVPGLSLVAAQPAAPDASGLPRLTFDAVPASVRVGLEEAYRAARANPRDAAAVGRLGMSLHAYEQYRSAQLCYVRARELEPQSMSWTYLSGVVEAALGENVAAASSFRRALEIEPDYWIARLRLAEALMAAGELDASGAEFEALTRERPELAVAHYGLGRLLSGRANLAAATECYRRAVELEPEFGAAHYALALAYRNSGSSDRGKAHLDAYRQFGMRRPLPPDPLLDQIRAPKRTARDLLAEGARLGRTGRLDEAIALHMEAVAADPADAQAHVNLISLYGRTQQRDKAEQHYRAALEIGGSLAEAHYNYGVLMASGARHGAATEAFRRVLGVNPFHAQAHNNLAGLLAAQGRLQEATAHYREALANDPQHRGARFNLGRVLVAQAQPVEAIEQFRKLLVREDQDTARCLYALANAYSAAGDPVQAGNYARQALRRAKAQGYAELAASIEQSLPRMKDTQR
jgi:tetratricopeptide (TPR) repeat protein